MTTTPSAVLPAPAAPAAPGARPGVLRLAVCALTILACVPYLTLKLSWLAGGSIGWRDGSAPQDTALYAANAVTMAMDAVAVAIVLAFTFAWGRRLPAWLVVIPMWVGTGLLAPIVLGLPLGAALQGLTSSAPIVPDTQDEMLRGWVFVMVYGGFSVQGIGLVTTFVLYARARWPHVFALRAADLAQGATRPVQQVLAYAAAVPTVGYAAMELVWAAGSGLGQPDDPARGLTIAQQTVAAVSGLVALAAVAGLLALVHRRGRAVPALVAVWTGAGAAFAWGLYSSLSTLAQPGGMGADTTVAMGYTQLAALLGGLVMGLTGMFLLAEASARNAGESARQSARPTASSAP
ncbi:hypothetical protein [Actinomadura hibisca]|uniref:hypothetical protein n=1 Tax=Actinomadura hibisca TaxID=68565 RepID=UPI00082D554B|nr:hypothetical protein [Actinomadura hibisca]